MFQLGHDDSLPSLLVQRQYESVIDPQWRNRSKSLAIDGIEDCSDTQHLQAVEKEKLLSKVNRYYWETDKLNKSSQAHLEMNFGEISLTRGIEVLLHK